jgi:Domain of unknown function (DUF4082)
MVRMQASPGKLTFVVVRLGRNSVLKIQCDLMLWYLYFWQQALFPNGVALTAGTIYVISCHTSVGFYSANSNFFTAAVTNGPITAPSSSVAGGNGVYIYGSAIAFPKNTYQASNYWVDVVFG